MQVDSGGGRMTIEMKGELAKLDVDQQQKVMSGVLTAVEKSVAEDIRRAGEHSTIRITRAEVKRRGQICLKIFRSLRGDLNWGLQRAIDHLPRYLRNELDGVCWQPDERRMWAPGDGA